MKFHAIEPLFEKTGDRNNGRPFVIFTSRTELCIKQTCIAQRRGCFDSFLSLVSASWLLYISCGSNQPLFDSSNETAFCRSAFAKRTISTGPILNVRQGTSCWYQTCFRIVVSLAYSRASLVYCTGLLETRVFLLSSFSVTHQ